jgi:hypothetical protein
MIILNIKIVFYERYLCLGIDQIRFNPVLLLLFILVQVFFI